VTAGVVLVPVPVFLLAALVRESYMLSYSCSSAAEDTTAAWYKLAG